MSVNYRGSDSFKTNFGGLLSLIAYIITLLMIVKVTRDVAMMENSKSESHDRTLNMELRKELSPMYTEDFNFRFMIAVEIEAKTGGESATIDRVPPEVGSFKVYL